MLHKLLGFDREGDLIQESLYQRHRCESENREIAGLNKALEADYRARLSAWEARKEDYLKERRKTEALMRRLKKKSLHDKSKPLVKLCESALTQSVYPSIFPKEFQLSYDPGKKVLVVDYQLPPPGSIPNIKQVKFLRSEYRLQEVYLAVPAFNKLYGNMLYQVALRSIHELYQTDERKGLASVVFNGQVRFIDKATGKPAETCVLSVQADRDKFLSINLARVDPRSCFEKLGGVSRDPLTSLIPVLPLLTVPRMEAKRLSASSTEVPLPTIDQSTNLAVLGWDKLSEIFKPFLQKEFREAGGNVLVSAPAPDGSVDAIAIDPDPLRGGEILIRAFPALKPVSAAVVLEFFEKVLTAWPARGVMLALHGYDGTAFDFARGKPLTLVHMGCLQTILKKHGFPVEFDMVPSEPTLVEERCSPTCVESSNTVPPPPTEKPDPT